MQHNIPFLLNDLVLCLFEAFKVAFAMKALLSTGPDIATSHWF